MLLLLVGGRRNCFCMCRYNIGEFWSYVYDGKRKNSIINYFCFPYRWKYWNCCHLWNLSACLLLLLPVYFDCCYCSSLTLQYGNKHKGASVVNHLWRCVNFVLLWFMASFAHGYVYWMLLWRLLCEWQNKDVGEQCDFCEGSPKGPWLDKTTTVRQSIRLSLWFPFTLSSSSAPTYLAKILWGM